MDQGDTTKMRMVAQEVIRSQLDVCAAKRERIDDRLASLTAATTTNAQAVKALSDTVASLTVSVTQLAATMSTQASAQAATNATQASTNLTQEGRLNKLETSQAVMAVKMGAAAVAGGGLVPFVQWIITAFSNR